jgi:hypothetical protein
MMSALHTTENNTGYLLQLREQLAGFRTASCRLAHEQVIELLDTLPSLNDDLANLSVRRKGFCTPELRRKLLGCAHTTANDVFARLADAVHATGILGNKALPSSLISAIALRIYRMDHEKSRLEKKIALAQHNKDAAEITSIQHQLSVVLARHDAAVAEMEEYRKYLLKSVDEITGF